MPSNFAFQVGDYSGSLAGWFDPGATTVNNVYGTGTITTTGTALYQFAVGYQPILLGKFVTGDPATWGSIGDSIISGQGGTSGQSDSSGSGGIYGYSFFVRGMHDFAGDTSTAIAAISASCPGQSYASIQGTNTKSYAFYKYAKYWIEDMGTNDFGSSPSVGSNVTVLANAQTAWSNIKANVVGSTKILRLGLLQRTSTTDSYATATNQTLTGSGWGAGGAVELFNQAMPGQVTAGNIFAYYRSTSTEDTTISNYLWKANGTAQMTTVDGLHPTSLGHSLIGQDLYSVVTNGSYP